MLKTSGENSSVFVNDVWKLRIDREWREALSKDSMLGKMEYAALDKMVGELGAQKFDVQFIIYSLIIIILGVALWWFFIHRQKSKLPPPIAKAS